MRLFTLFFLFLLTINISAQKYSFFAAGHVYGSPGVNNKGVHPPFKQQFEYLNSLPNLQFGFFTGDIVYPSPVEQDWIDVDKDLESLNVPVHFVVGNHDMENKPLYISRYDSTYGYFIQNNDLFIILDANLDNWSIKGEQLEMFKSVITNQKDIVDNIFILTHQVIWWEYDNVYSHISLNSHAGKIEPLNFWSEIEPFVHELDNNIFFIAGDVGAGSWSSDFMFDKYDNITFVASGMGKGPTHDNYLMVDVDKNKNVEFNLLCLNDTNRTCFGDINNYIISNLEPEITNVSPTIIESTLMFPKEFLNTTFHIYNTNGQPVYSKNIKDQSIDLSILKTGFYILLIEEKDFSLKFIKK